MSRATTDYVVLPGKSSFLDGEHTIFVATLHTHQLRRAPSDTTYSFGTPFGASKKSPLDE